jgi:hypothetical protein
MRCDAMRCGDAMRCDDRFRQSSRIEPLDRFAVRNYTSSHAARVDARSAPPLKVPQDCPPKPRMPCRATPVIEVACVGAAERAALRAVRAVLVSVVRIASARAPSLITQEGSSGHSTSEQRVLRECTGRHRLRRARRRAAALRRRTDCARCLRSHGAHRALPPPLDAPARLGSADSSYQRLLDMPHETLGARRHHPACSARW